MATALAPYGGQVIAPAPSDNQVDRVGQVSAASDAKLVVEQHIAALRARRPIELVWEKLLLHIDGSGDFQWADIFYDTRVEIPRFLSEFRKTENVLRLIVDNAVSHHTSMPLRYAVEHGPDRRSIEKAIIDTIWGNFLAQVQFFNALFAEALYLAMPAGFCPVHRYWREDVETDWYEPIEYGGYKRPADLVLEQLGLKSRGQGMIDCWVGNPFDHVFNPGAKRNSIRWSSYARLVNADAFRHVYGHIPGVAGLQGTTRLASAAEWQRVAQNWRMAGLGIHGSPIMNPHHGNGEELITVICLEHAPGADSRYPDGRLQIVAVPGDVDTRQGRANGGHALKVADQKLPARDFSFTLFYSDHRGSDVHGKPWPEDKDQKQVDLNIALSKRWEVVNKMVEAPIVAPGGAIGEDMADLGGYNMIEVEPSLANWRPKVMEWPQGILPALDSEIREHREYIFRAGGYQAASRGEAPGSRTPYRAILALQQADNTVHGPINLRFQKSATDFLGGCWRQMKTYGDKAWLVTIAGDHYAHLVEPYIDKTMLSDRPPRYKLVNAFGSSPEMRAQEILELVQLRTADGQPFLRTDEGRRIYPNPIIFDDAGDPALVQRRRARTISTAVHQLAKKYRERTGFDETKVPPQWRRQFIEMVGMQLAFGEFDPMGNLLHEGLEQLYPRLIDDDLFAHLAAYSEVTQDETADPLARAAMRHRQALYFEWQRSMSMGMGEPMQGRESVERLRKGSGGGGGGGADQNVRGMGADRRNVTAEMNGREGKAGNPERQAV